ncbi:MBG domain-containing protein [Sphingobacterium psychroaquaticum]|uniref:Gliding motility-associated C-terminal domain-containing protein n=1 Tax=Sphingobacterium psychroaquaticum TaxID=561061 RepID=A0A1X7I203_9SPHI|nr:MBG domain-containing protein [Sphingobacterium psychroaquaticum]SMG08164.1 gliding motility-associated C-terminal domain-containing protein [Sphingobacterium psychroaquaticum]
MIQSNTIYRLFCSGLLLMLLLVKTGTSYAQCTDDYGVLAFTGYQIADAGNPQGQQDQFSFILLEYLPANTSIFFTDFGLTDVGQTIFQTVAQSPTDGILEWKSTTPLEGGTLVVVKVGDKTATHGAVTETLGSFNFGIGGDQLFAYKMVSGAKKLQAALLLNKDAWNLSMPAVSSSASLNPNLPPGFKQSKMISSPDEDAYQARMNVGLAVMGSRQTLRQQVFNHPLTVFNDIYSNLAQLEQLAVAWNVDAPTKSAIVKNGIILSITSDACYYQWQESANGVDFVDIGQATTSTMVTNASYSSPRWFRVRLSGAKTVYTDAIRLGPQNLTLTASAGTTSYMTNAETPGAAVPIDPALSIVRLEPEGLSSAKVAITGNLQMAQDVLSFTNNPATMGNITASFNASTGEMKLTSNGATAIPEQWQRALQSVTYSNSSSAPTLATRTVSFTLTGEAETSNTVTKQVSVTKINTAPIANSDAYTVNEDSQLTVAAPGILVNDTDADGDALTAVLVVGPSSGTLTLSANGSFTYTPVPNFNGTDSFTYKANDGTSDSNIATVSISVTAVNDAPTVTVPSTITVKQHVATTITGISFADIDAGAAPVTATFSIPSGSLNATTGSGVTVSSQTQTNTITLTGSIVDINTFIAMGRLTLTVTGIVSQQMTVNVNDNGNTGSGGAKNASTSFPIIVTPATNPKVTNVSSPMANVAYGTGSAISIDVTFDQPVTVTTGGGSPTLLLETGVNDQKAVYFSGSGTSTLTFTYVVQAGDVSSDLDYKSTSALELNDSRIKNGLTEDALLTLPTPGASGSLGANKNLVIDGVAPTGTILINNGALYTNHRAVTLSLTSNKSNTQIRFSNDGVSWSGWETFSVSRSWILLEGDGAKTVSAQLRDAVGNVSTTLHDNIVVDTQPPVVLGVTNGELYNTNRTITYDEGNATLNGANFTSGTIVSAEGSYTLVVTDAAGNTTIVSFTIDKTAPVVTAVSVPANGYYKTNDVLTFELTMSEPVHVLGQVDHPHYIPITIGSAMVKATYVRNNNRTLTFQYVVKQGDTDLDGITLGREVVIERGSITDAAGNSMLLTLNNVASTTGVRVSTIPPTVTLTTSIGITNKPFIVTATFSEAVVGLSVGDLSVLNTTVSNLSTTDNITYTFLLSPAREGEFTIYLPAGSVQNIGGNDNVRSNTLRVIYDQTPPAQPTGFQAKGGNGQAVLQWNKNMEVDLKGYRLTAKKAGEPEQLVATLTESETSYTHTGLTNGMTYTYFLRAVDVVDNEGPYASATATTQGEQTITFDPLNTVSYGMADLVLTAVSTSGLPVVYASSNNLIAEPYIDVADGNKWKLKIKGAGNALITARQAGDAAYLAAPDVVRGIDVTKAPLNVIANDITKVYGAMVPVLTARYDGFVNGDAAADLLSTPVLTTVAVAGSSVGTYPILVSGVTSNNYTITHKAGAIVVTPAVLVVDANASNKVYGANDPVFTYTVSGFVNNEDKSVLTGVLGRAAGQEDVGVYAITRNTLNAANYTLDYTGNNLSITPALLTVTAKDETKVFGTMDPAWIYDVDGLQFNDTDHVVSGTLTREPGEEVGSYAILGANLATNANYTLKYMPGVFEITKATLTGLSLNDASFTYDGSAKSLLLQETLPQGTSVSYVGNAKTDAGIYEVTATVDGGVNYIGQTHKATMTVEKATLTGLSLNDASFTYDGSAKSLLLQGTLPQGTSVSYVGNAKTDAGTYEVTATVDGGVNYVGQTLKAKLTITKATLTGLSLKDAGFTYDGSAKSLVLQGTLPQGTSVSYVGNAKTDAGTYEVTATVDGGVNYVGQTLKAKLTITKAKQQITFTAPAVLGRDAGTVPMDVKASSGLPVQLTIDEPMVARINGLNLEVLRLGTVVVTATQSGDANFEAAAPVSVTVRVKNSADAPLPIRVHQAVSPNGDGINEFLMIEGIQDYPENKVTIFDKSGKVLKVIERYDNRENVFTADHVIDGTYYYYLDIKDDNGQWKRDKGYFVVKR